MVLCFLLHRANKPNTVTNIAANTTHPIEIPTIAPVDNDALDAVDVPSQPGTRTNATDKVAEVDPYPTELEPTLEILLVAQFYGQ